MGKKKRFIDKKNAVTFHLVHRSQKDPLQADESAPKHVLLQEEPRSEKETNETRKEQQINYGIFYEDEYDYMQHLKDVNDLNNVEPTEVFRIQSKSVEKNQQEPRLKLPSTVFGSEAETKVGLLNKAAPISGPQLDWDPDIVEALDDDFNFDDPDNQLDDEFVVTANSDQPLDLPEETTQKHHPHIKEYFRPEIEIDEDDDEEENEEEEGGSSGEDFPSDELESGDEGSDIASLGAASFGKEETKSRFTNYSMTSSVIRRNQGLTLLDDRFEKLYVEYDDEEIGPLEQEDIGGCVQPGSCVLDHLVGEFEEQQKDNKLKDVDFGNEGDVDMESESSSEEEILVPAEAPKEQWDCESILSTYSNLYNHPKLIEEPKKNPIQLTKRMQIPANVLAERGLTRAQVEREQIGRDRGDCANTYRPKNETMDEKKARKQAIKEERRARREEKKGNKLAFKSEAIRQHKEKINVDRNLKGLKIV